MPRRSVAGRVFEGAFSALSSTPVTPAAVAGDDFPELVTVPTLHAVRERTPSTSTVR
jgi:hypothetical protein